MNGLQKTRCIMKRMQQSMQDTRIWFYPVIRVVSEVTLSNVYWIDEQGEWLDYSVQEATPNDPFWLFLSKSAIPECVNQRFLAADQTQSNVQWQEKEADQTGEAVGWMMFVPIRQGPRRFGTLVFYRREKPWDEEEVCIAEYLCMIIAFERSQQQRYEAEREIDKQQMVHQVVQSLSSSERALIDHLLTQLPEDKGLMITGKISDQLGIARSIMANALSKLQGAGVIQTQSLGMKGTYIQILTPWLRSEMGKLSSFQTEMMDLQKQFISN